MSQEENSRKRPAQYRIDQKTLQQAEQGDYDQNKKEKQSSAQQKGKSLQNNKISERKILRIKKDIQQPKEPGKINFMLIPLLENTQKNDTDKSQENKDNQSDNNEGSKNGTQKGAEQKYSEKKKTQDGGIYGSKNGAELFSGSLFGGSSNSNIFGTSNGSSLFGISIDHKEGNSSVNTGLGLKINSDGGLSGIFAKGASIFNFQKQVPPESKSTGIIFGGNSIGGEDGSGDQAEIQRIQKLDSDPSKSTGVYKYEETTDKTIFSKPVKKFKKNASNLIDGVEVLIQQDQHGKKSWVIARLVATKNPIITGHIIKGVSTVRHISNKEENVQLALICMKEGVPTIYDKDSQPKPEIQKVYIRLQFQEAVDGKAFHDEIKKLI